jgi:hypothetical protein
MGCATIVALIALVQYVFVFDVTQYMDNSAGCSQGWTIGFEVRGGGCGSPARRRTTSSWRHFWLSRYPSPSTSLLRQKPGRRQLALVCTAIIAGRPGGPISRTGMLALALVSLVLFPVWSWRSGTTSPSSPPSLAQRQAVASPGLVSHSPQSVRRPSTNPAFTVRAERYPMVFHYVAQRPWLGRGTGTLGRPRSTRSSTTNGWTRCSQRHCRVAVLALLPLTVSRYAFMALRRSTTAEARSPVRRSHLHSGRRSRGGGNVRLVELQHVRGGPRAQSRVLRHRVAADPSESNSPHVDTAMVHRPRLRISYLARRHRRTVLSPTAGSPVRPSSRPTVPPCPPACAGAESR